MDNNTRNSLPFIRSPKKKQVIYVGAVPVIPVDDIIAAAIELSDNDYFEQELTEDHRIVLRKITQPASKGE